MRVPTTHADFDECNARFDEPASQKTALAEGESTAGNAAARPTRTTAAAIAIARGGRFARQIKGFQSRAADHVGGAVDVGAMVGDARLSTCFGEIAFEVLHQIETAIEALAGRAAGQGGVGWHLIRIADAERRKLHGEEAMIRWRPPKPAAADLDEVGQIEIAWPNLAGDDGADARETDAADREIAGLHEIGGALMLAFAVVHGADQGDALHLAGQESASCRRCGCR